MRSTFLPVLRFAALFCCLGLAGCPKTPLGDPKTSNVDPALGGYWLHVAEGDSKEQTVVSIAPIDERVYVIQTFESKGDGEEEMSASEAYRGWLTDVKGTRFLTIEPIASAAHKAFHPEVAYPIYRIKLAGDDLTAHLLNDGLPGLSDAKTPEALKTLIAEKVDDPALVEEDAVKLRRLKADDAGAKKLIERLPVFK